MHLAILSTQIHYLLYVIVMLQFLPLCFLHVSILVAQVGVHASCWLLAALNDHQEQELAAGARESVCW